MKQSAPYASLLYISLLIYSSLGACSSSQSPGAVGAVDDLQNASGPASGGQIATVKDLTRAGLSAPYDGAIPIKATTRTFVPWDSTAIVEVVSEGELEAGTLVVYCGKSWDVDDGGAWTIYVLEAPGPKIEPISIEWQPEGGASLRVIARVDGELRRYDFDR